MRKRHEISLRKGGRGEFHYVPLGLGMCLAAHLSRHHLAGYAAKIAPPHASDRAHGEPYHKTAERIGAQQSAVKIYHQEIPHGFIFL